MKCIPPFVSGRRVAGRWAEYFVPTPMPKPPGGPGGPTHPPHTAFEKTLISILAPKFKYMAAPKFKYMAPKFKYMAPKFKYTVTKLKYTDSAKTQVSGAKIQMFDTKFQYLNFCSSKTLRLNLRLPFHSFLSPHLVLVKN